RYLARAVRAPASRHRRVKYASVSPIARRSESFRPTTSTAVAGGGSRIGILLSRPCPARSVRPKQPPALDTVFRAGAHTLDVGAMCIANEQQHGAAEQQQGSRRVDFRHAEVDRKR